MNAEIPYGQEDFHKAAKAEAEKATHFACEQLKSAGVDAQGEVVESHTVWRGILENAGKAHADLVVMGSHGRHGLEKLVLGSVTQRVLQHASVPVMVVRGE
jgi:nucleotide-binding universal stress UspA family protein